MKTRFLSEDGHLRVCHEDDVEDVIEDNKRWQNAGKQNGDFRKVASIPLIILTKWLHEEWNRGNVTLKPGSQEMERIVARKLQDPDWKYLRTDK